LSVKAFWLAKDGNDDMNPKPPATAGLFGNFDRSESRRTDGHRPFREPVL
jgi:hypothetical protein